MLSPVQLDIVREIGKELKPMAEALTDALMVESVGRVEQLLEDLRAAAAGPVDDLIVEMRGRHVELHGRHIVIYSEWPRAGVPPETVTIRLINCAWENCGGAFTVDSKEASGEWARPEAWRSGGPEWRRFHARRCLVAWHNQQRKSRNPPETSLV